MCLLEGDRENAHYSPRYADWLIDHAEWLPLWSSIKRDEFGYGRIPATSASVESDFNHLKNRVLSDVTLPIRTDDFLQKHLKYLRGNMNIVNASKNVNNNCQVESLSILQKVPRIQFHLTHRKLIVLYAPKDSTHQQHIFVLFAERRFTLSLSAQYRYGEKKRDMDKNECVTAVNNLITKPCNLLYHRKKKRTGED